jgi:hypothetical protein
MAATASLPFSSPSPLDEARSAEEAALPGKTEDRMRPRCTTPEMKTRFQKKSSGYNVLSLVQFS